MNKESKSNSAGHFLFIKPEANEHSSQRASCLLSLIQVVIASYSTDWSLTSQSDVIGQSEQRAVLGGSENMGSWLKYLGRKKIHIATIRCTQITCR